MINIYDFIRANSSFFDQSTFGKNGDIFIDYMCPIKELEARVWSQKNCLMYVMQGTKGYESFHHFHESTEHQVLFIQKGGVVLHQFFAEPYRALIFMFDDSVLIDFISDYPDMVTPGSSVDTDFSTFSGITELKSNQYIRSIFISALDYLKNPTPESTISLEIKFKELLVNVLREKESNTFIQYLYWIFHEKEASFVKLMRENSPNNFTVKELARIACMSLSTFKREFVRILGVPPGQWLDNQRITRAYHLLSNTEKSVGEISFDLGYNDTSAFSRWFKRHSSQSPAEYRRKRQN